MRARKPGQERSTMTLTSHLSHLAVAALSPAVVWATAGCGDNANSGEPANGVVRGKLTTVGGPYPGGEHNLVGSIVIVSRLDGTKVTQQPTDAASMFRFTLPAGRYQLTADGVQGCAAAAEVTPSSDTTVNLTCSIK